MFRSKNVLPLFIVASSLSSICFAVGSGGFENQVPSARTLGRANTVVATIDDASATSFNPARLSASKQGNLLLGFTYQNINTTLDIKGGGSESADNDPGISPNFHLAHNFGSEKWAFGLSVTAPHGSSTKWSKSSVVAPSVTEANVAIVDINPAVAYKINDTYSVGAGLDLYAIDAELKSYDSAGPLETITEGDGSGLSGNIGLSAKFNDHHFVGFSFRKGVNIDVEGTVKTEGVFVSNTDAETELNIPDILMLGYGYKPNERLTLEWDLQWNKWSSFDNLELKDKNTGTQLSWTAKDWRNRWSIGFGTEYALKERLFVRGGYSFWSTSIPNETFEPSTPDADTHAFTAGIGSAFGNTTVDFGIGIYRLNNRHINDSQLTPTPTPSGTYKTHAEYFALNVGYRFGATAQ